jgi:FixJ family two-component response regulator
MGADGRPVIVVDDEQLVADTIALILRSNGYEALALYDPKSAIAQLETLKPAIVISDIEMPGMNGVQLAVFIQQRYPDCRVILISGHADTIASLDEARRKGHVFEVLQKPIPPADLLTKIAS